MLKTFVILFSFSFVQSNIFLNGLRYERALSQRVHFGTLLNLFAGESTTVGVPMTGEFDDNPTVEVRISIF